MSGAIKHFYPRSPCGERRVTVLGVQHRTGISIHALLAESDANTQQEKNNGHEFLSTLSLRRATFTFLLPLVLILLFLSTLSLRRATINLTNQTNLPNISIHALLAESDIAIMDNIIFVPGFLSTLSLRRATRGKVTNEYDRNDFYPRSPCGERRLLKNNIFFHHSLFLSTLSLRRATYTDLDSRYGALISIHALLAESDYRQDAKSENQSISIHALLAESDLAGPSGPAFLFNFYPRSPCGERHPARPTASTGATKISIHALLAESDQSSSGLNIRCIHFYPRSPCGERLLQS